MRAKLKEVKEGAATAHAPDHPRARAMAGAGRRGLLQLPSPCRPTTARSAPSATGSPTSGDARFGGAAKRIARPGSGWTSWSANSSPSLDSSTPGPATVSPSNTRGGSRMRASRTYGSVRGARSNARPYRKGALSSRGWAERPRGRWWQEHSSRKRCRGSAF